MDDMRYADPDLCPDCRSDLPHGVRSCPTCSLPVRHALAIELFSTLQHADTLVDRLRSLSNGATVPSAARTTTGLVPPGPVATAPTRPAAPAAPAAPVPPRPAAPVPPPPPAAKPAGPAAPYPTPPRSGLGVAIIPKILLGLGAFCLLAAAIGFLAVAWDDIGVGGRTAVLLTLTAAATGGSLLLNRFELRIAAESMSVVALGMLGLDVIGAHAAGWFGDSSTGWAVATGGAVMALGGTGMALPRFGDGPRLVAPQVFVGVGYLIAWGGLLAAMDHPLVSGHALVVLGAVVTWLSRTALPVRAWSVGIATAVVWSATALLGVGHAFADPTTAGLWIDGAGWSLVASAATLLAPGLVLKRRDLTVGGASVGALLVTIALVAPAVDESARIAGAVTLAVTAAWVAAYRLLPTTLRTVALAPAAIGSLALLGFDAVAGIVVLARIAEVGPDSPFGVVLREPDPATEPLLTVPSVLVPLALLALLVPQRADGRSAPWWQTGAVVGGVAAVATLASYDVALALVVAALGVVAIGSLVLGLVADGTRQTSFGLVALGIGATGIVLALPSTPIVAVASGILLGMAMIAHFVGRTTELRGVAAVTLSPALAALVWTAGLANDVDARWLGVPLLLLLGVLAIARPRLQVEVPAVLVALVAVPPAIFAADDAGGSLALHLVVLGALLSASALIHESRRELAWAAVPVFALASWVWFGDRGVTAPEPYTLPIAADLTLLGLIHLQRKPDAGTEAALLPGLLLGTVPSLLWVLDDPVSLRALFLGGACLVLTIAGAALRWSAPLMVGSVVGAIVVLREIGPYAGDVPQWVWIGLAGALLTTVGITWERRLLEIRNAVGLLGRLR
ncbi:hypothetical protein D0Z08_01895 [Nocardioides immobilis]|uniref:DUF2157 domain-containing protein n=1 Tax=Nocardioides immobilis TaxID=2049295 RepID=A0A417Y848_9ACTN|nr:hypothetical protein [Nocardioides immobilis]RHW28634.1 hypothetical protein D0Z08_01895 [Nocardioides immobilis]